MFFFLVAFVTSTFLVAVRPTPTGAPESCCDNMLPQHGALPQVDQAPYQLRAAKNADDTFTVVVRDATGVTPFKGFLLEARRQSTDTIVGTFIGKPDDTTQYLTCVDTNNAVTHTDPSLKSDLTFTWDPQGADVNGVVFVATVVQETAIFWTFLTSADLSTLP